MPELPEVETVKNGIKKFIGNAVIRSVEVRNRQLRAKIPEDFEQAVSGATVCSYRRRGKYIVMDLNNGNSIVCHLGMSGKLKTTDEPPTAPDKHDHLIIQTSAGCLVYNDPRRFGLFFAAPTTELEKLPCFSKLGKDPFAADFDGEYLFSGCRRRHKAVKPVLLDQSFIAGIGNIYASEILFDAGIRPTRRANSLSRKECSRLAASTRKILQTAVDNGGSSIHDYQQPDGRLGYFQYLHRVYDKTGCTCPDCPFASQKNGGIRKIVQDGRSTYYCPVKQK